MNIIPKRNKIDEFDDIIDNLDGQMNDLEGKFEDLSDKITNFIDVKFNLEKLFQNFLIPFTYNKELETIVKRFDQSSYSYMIEDYRKFKKSFGKKKELPEKITEKYFQENSEKISVGNSMFLKNAIEFYNHLKIVSEETKPIFFYYSSVYFLSFLQNSLLKFNSNRKSHGLQVKKMENINNIEIGFQNQGFFPRIVDTFSIFGYYSIFSPFWPTFKKGNDISQKHKFRKNDLLSNYLDSKTVKLETLFELDFDLFLRSEFKSHKSSQFGKRFIHTSEILRDYIVIFCSSNIARYNPHLWNTILKGEITDLLIKIKKAYLNFEGFILFILEMINSIKKTLKNEINVKETEQLFGRFKIKNNNELK